MNFEVFEDANRPVLHIATDYQISDDGETHLQNVLCQINIEQCVWDQERSNKRARAKAEMICAAMNGRIAGGFPSCLHDDPDYVDPDYRGNNNSRFNSSHW